MSHTERNCTKLKMGEKTILHKLIALADKCAPLLADDMTFKQAREIVSKSKEYDNYTMYIDLAIIPLLKMKESEGDINTTKQINQKLSQARP